MQHKTPSTVNFATSDSGIEISNCDETAPEVLTCKSSDTSTLSDGPIYFSAEPRSTDDVFFAVRLWRKLWPPMGPFAKWFTWFIVLCALFAALWALAPEQLVPGESAFSLVLTILLCFAAEALFVKIPTPEGFPPLPPLLASLLMGLALKNLPPPANIATSIDPEISRVLREIALTIILTEAGLEIDSEAMMKVKWAVCRLAFLPCIGETAVIGVLAHFILGFPFIWSFMMGFMIAAVSPAVVVPSLIIIQDAGLGIAKGIPSLIMAASGIDDVLAIAGFTVLLGIAIPSGLEEDLVNAMMGPSDSPADHYTVANTTDIMSSTDLMNSTMALPSVEIGRAIVGSIIEIVIGIVSGVFLGFFISTFPSKDMKLKSFCRGFLLLSIGILFVFGTNVWGIPGAGSLCALIMSFVASIRWGDERKPLGHAWHYMWKIFQPILFGLTGALVSFSEMNGRDVGLGLAVLFCAIAVRLTISTLVTFGLKLNIKERIFVSISWIPKGTVQAALGSAALDQAIKQKRSSDEIHMGDVILWLAVLITLITAPIGAFGISLSGPRLLAANSSLAEPSGEDNLGFENKEVTESAYWDKKIPFSDSLVDVRDYGLCEIREENADLEKDYNVKDDDTQEQTLF